MRQLLICLTSLLILLPVTALGADLAISVERILSGIPGQAVNFGLTLDNPTEIELGGFDILLRIDSALAVQSVLAG